MQIELKKVDFALNPLLEIKDVFPSKSSYKELSSDGKKFNRLYWHSWNFY